MNTLIPSRISHWHVSAAVHLLNGLRSKIFWFTVLSGVSVMVAGCATPIAQAPPPAAPVAPPAPYNGPTLCKVLGVPDAVAAGKECCTKVQTCLKRQFPGVGAPPNLGPVDAKSSPAVKCAAEILAAEAEVPQKVDALRYLGRVGCTKCYPCVEEGLLAAIDDCSEVVRFEAAKAIRSTATEQCNCCQCTSCCTKRIHDKLHKVAFDTNCDGCPVECSSRVRRVARQALCMCGGPGIDTSAEQEPTPSEGPRGQIPPTKPVSDTGKTAPAPVPAPTASGTNSSDTSSENKAPAVTPQPEANKGADATRKNINPMDPLQLSTITRSTETSNQGRFAAKDGTSTDSLPGNGCRACGKQPTSSDPPSSSRLHSNPFDEGSSP